MRIMGAVPLRLDHEIGKPHRRRGSRQRQESERRRIPGAGLSRQVDGSSRMEQMEYRRFLPDEL